MKDKRTELNKFMRKMKKRYGLNSSSRPSTFFKPKLVGEGKKINSLIYDKFVMMTANKKHKVTLRVRLLDKIFTHIFQGPLCQSCYEIRQANGGQRCVFLQ